MKIRTTALAATVAAAMGLPAVGFAAITIDGITFEEGSIFELGELFEAERLGDNNGNDNGFIDQVGEELIGVGRITSIRRADNSVIWDAATSSQALTLYFYDFIAEFASAVTDPLTNVTTTTILFSGGLVDLYSQPAAGLVLPTATQAGGIAAATQGNLWLSLAGSPLLGTGAFANPITLSSAAIGVDPNNPFTSGNVFGQGRLDVTGGPASVSLDTNTFGCLTNQGQPNCPDDADKSFSSEGGLQPGSTSEWKFTGNLTVRDFAVPEPGTLALLGLGLAGLGYASRRNPKFVA